MEFKAILLKKYFETSIFAKTRKRKNTKTVEDKMKYQNIKIASL